MPSPSGSPISLSQFYRGTNCVPINASNSIPTSGTISVSDFRGTRYPAFNYTRETFTASSNQTVFSVTRASGYIAGQCLVFQNGVLLDASEYTDTAGSTGTVTLAVGATTGDTVSIMSFRYVDGSVVLTRNTVDLIAATTYTASGFTLTSGQELLFMNGLVMTSGNYSIAGQVISGFPSTMTGKLTIIQWALDKPVNTTTNTVVGQATYSVTLDSTAFNLYNNGVLLMVTGDYTTATNSYTLVVTPTTTLNLLLQQAIPRRSAA